MTEDHQSQFSAEQAILQKPPELTPPQYQDHETHTTRRAQYRKLAMGVGVFFVLVIVISGLYRVFFFHPSNSGVTPPPSPTPFTQELTGTQKILYDLNVNITKADPQTFSFPPPPVDMRVTF